MNGFTELVKVEPYAVGDQSGQAAFYQCGHEGMSRLGAPNPRLGASAAPAPVEMTFLDKYVADGAPAPDILFIDIEGFEFQALAGARRLITSNWALVTVCEMHPDSWALAGYDRQTAERLIKELRLTPVALQNQSDPMGEHGIVWLKSH